MRGGKFAAVTVAVVAGLVLGALLSPPPADAVAKEIIQLQQQVAELLQNQQSMQNDQTQNFAVLKTLIGQNADSQNRLTAEMGSLQKTVQDLQANSGSQINSMSGQVQTLSDSLVNINAAISKLSGQVATLQNSLQTIDAKVSALATPQNQGQPSTNPTGETGAAPGAAPGGADAGPPSATPTAADGAAPQTQPQVPSGPAPPANMLYNNGLRDFVSGNNGLARQEFTQYLQYYGQTDLASNAHFYLGEIDRTQGRYAAAIGQYDQVLEHYPNSFKRADARLEKGLALLKLKEKSLAIAELRRVVRDNPGTDQARKARAQLRELGVAAR